MESPAVNDFRWQPPVLTTTRLCIRPFSPADIERLYPLASNANVTRYTLWQAHRSADDTRNFIETYAQGNYLQQVPEPMAVCPIENIAVVYGAVGCFWVAREHKSMEVGYWIAEPYWGRGLAGEAARALVDYSFREFGVERMQAHCVVPNVASSRVIEKLGFQFEGVARSAVHLRGRFYDVKRYAVLRSEWLSEKPK